MSLHPNAERLARQLGALLRAYVRDTRDIADLLNHVADGFYRSSQDGFVTLMLPVAGAETQKM